MARADHPIHGALAELLGDEAATVVDLGCGGGGTLAAVAARCPGAWLVGIDANVEDLARAQSLLGTAARGVGLVRADLDEPLPLADGSVDATVCHNVLENLHDPGALLREASRILRPGGTAVWSHVDFDSFVVGGADVALDRRVLHAYADAALPWAPLADARMGRKLAGLVSASPLVLERVHAFPFVWTDLSGDAQARVAEIAAVLADAEARGPAPVDSGDVAEWRRQLEESSRSGSFFLAEVVFTVVSRRRA
ncbi:MAG TPA: methyltransferase domain-containing protein [Anaeromyxobacter sp.]|nr:methyltransferase domain-containing protein [Anaeromyxobacter sp.]